MSKFTADVTFDCWKQHECIGCGCEYRYGSQRRMIAGAGSHEAARNAARQNLTKILQRQCEYRPCPDCGLIQPDMIAYERRYIEVFLWLVPPLTFAVIMFATLLHLPGVTYAVASVVLLVAAVALAVLTAFQVTNPNKDLEANRERAAHFLVDDTIQRMTPGDPYSNEPQARLLGGHWLVVGLIAAAGLAGSAAAIMRVSNDWPSNDTWPEIVGPGDTTRFYFPDQIQSVNGHWVGEVGLNVPPQLGIENIPFTATTRTRRWGDKIQVEEEEKFESATLWIDLTAPDDPRLAGQTVRLEAQLDVIYPQLRGGRFFDEAIGQFTRPITLRLGPPHCGGLYSKAFWLGATGGVVLLLAAANYFRSLRKRLRNQAHPAVIELREWADEGSPP